MNRTLPLHGLASPACVCGVSACALVGGGARGPMRGTERERGCESEHEVFICELLLFILSIQGLKDEGKSYKVMGIFSTQGLFL